MFANSIYTTPFTNVDVPPFNKVDDEFGAYCDDRTFGSTLKALLAPRMPESEAIHMIIQSYDRYCTVVPEEREGYFVIGHCGERYDKTRYYEAASNAYRAKNFEQLEAISKFFESKVKVECFVDRNRKICFINCETMSTQIYHFLQAAALAFFPWYFNGKTDKISNLELKLLGSFKHADPREYITTINQLAEDSGVREAMVHSSLVGFENSKNVRQLAELEESNRRYNVRLRDLANEMQSINRNVRENRIRILGLQQISTDNDDVLERYFLSHPQFNVVDTSNDGEVTFVVRDDCIPDAPEEIEPFIDNPSGYVVTERNGGDIAVSALKRLLKAIFIEKTLKLKLCAAYKISAGRFEALSGYAFDTRYWDWAPNPHIQRYACMGAYTSIINEALTHGDYPYALEQTIGSVRSINFADVAVMRWFIQYLYDRTNHTRKFLELPDGTRATIPDALTYLSNLDKAKEESNE